MIYALIFLYLAGAFNSLLLFLSPHNIGETPQGYSRRSLSFAIAALVVVWPIYSVAVFVSHFARYRG